MNTRPMSCAILLLAFGAGCPDGGSKPPETTTPTTEEPSTPATTTEPEPDWTALLAALAATEATELPTAALPPDAGADAQLYEGESAPALTDPAGGADIVSGGIYTVKLPNPAIGFTESWVSFGDEGALLQPATAGVSQTLKLKHVDGGFERGTLDAAKISTLCQRADAAALKISDQAVRYFGFPQPNAITSLPSQLPANTAPPITYEVYTSNMGQPDVRTGSLYRELQTPAGGVPVWKDFWVLENDYVFPGPGVETRIKRVNTGGFTTLKAYLQAQQASRAAETPANQGKWLYAPTSYSWRTLCVTPVSTRPEPAEPARRRPTQPGAADHTPAAPNCQVTRPTSSPL